MDNQVEEPVTNNVIRMPRQLPPKIIRTGGVFTLNINFNLILATSVKP